MCCITVCTCPGDLVSLYLYFDRGALCLKLGGGVYCIVAAADNDDICNLSTLLSICTVTAI